MLRVKEIHMDYLKEPMGTAGCPSFGWKLESDRRNVWQTAYRLWIRKALDGGAVYDSGWVESSQALQLQVKAELTSLTGYQVQVQVRDGVEESPVSEPACFVTGMLRPEEWQAAFISAEEPEEADSSKGTLLRKQICLSGEIECAYVCTTALGLYHFYINGKKVGADELTPGWTSYRKHLCYQTYEVTELLRSGRNMLGAMVGAGWYKGKMGFLHLRNNYGVQTAFFMQLKIRYRDGREETVVSDETWQGADAPVLFSEIYDGESYDARLEQPGWNEPGWNQPGWNQPWDARQGAAAGVWSPVNRVEYDRGTLTAQPGGRVQKIEELPVKQIFVTPEGDTVLDFGQNLTGWVEFSVCGEPGEEALLQCFETLDAAGNVYTDNLRTAKQTVRYVCNGESAVYHPHFTFQGFQYVRVIRWPGGVSPEALEKAGVRAWAMHSQMEQTGSFRCSHELVNRLQHNILWGLKGNFVDIPTDCPQRDERMGWTGDAQIFCRTACYLMNTDVFFGKWLTDLAADQTPEGGVPHMVPDIITGKGGSDWLLSQGTHSAAAWADAAVINPWTLYLVYGDRQVLKRQYESMKSWILFMKRHAVDDIWNYKLQFGDWVALDAEEGSYFGATPNDLTCTAYYAYSTGLFAKIAGILGRSEDEREYAALYRRIVDKFRRTFFREDGTMTAQTQTAHIVALYFQLVPEKYREQTAKRLAQLLAEQEGHLVTGFVGTPYFCHALSENGYTREAYELLLKEDFPSWLYQVKMGATTVWEHWDGKKPDGSMWSKDMNSFNHYAYGAVGDWLYRVALGLEADEREPGYRHVLLQPQTGEAFSYAEGSYESVYGTLAVRWERIEDSIRLEFQIPANTHATVRLEPGAEKPEAEGLRFEARDGRLTAECGSGSWSVTYRRKL